MVVVVVVVVVDAFIAVRGAVLEVQKPPTRKPPVNCERCPTLMSPKVRFCWEGGGVTKNEGKRRTRITLHRDAVETKRRGENKDEKNRDDDDEEEENREARRSRLPRRRRNSWTS